VIPYLSYCRPSIRLLLAAIILPKETQHSLNIS